MTGWRMLFLALFGPADPGYLANALEYRKSAAPGRDVFREAADAYDRRWATVRSPAVASNRGRAHFQAGDTPAAVLAFREAAAVYPWHADTRRGLELCRDAVPYPPGLRPPPVGGVRARLSPADRLGLSVVGSVLVTAGLVARFATRPRWSAPAVGVGGVGLLLVAAAAWQIEREAAADGRVAVVVADRVTVRQGNADSFPPRLDAPLPRGAEVRPLGERGGWVQVELANGAVGWVPGGVVRW